MTVAAGKNLFQNKLTMTMAELWLNPTSTKLELKMIEVRLGAFCRHKGKARYSLKMRSLMCVSKTMENFFMMQPCSLIKQENSILFRK